MFIDTCLYISSEVAKAFIPACLDKIWLSSYFKRITLYEFHIVTVIDSTVHGFITNQHYDQLPGGLVAQMVEHCTGIAKGMHGFCLSSVHYCEGRFHIQYYVIVRATRIFSLIRRTKPEKSERMITVMTRVSLCLLPLRWTSMKTV